MMKNAIATERSDLHRLANSAIRAANSSNVSDDERCFDILRYMKSLNLSVNDLCHSKAIRPLASLRDHENPKIRMEAHVLFNSWMEILYSSGRYFSTCNKAHDIAAETKKKTEVLGLQKNEDERSRAHETGEIKQIDECKSFSAKLVQAKKRRVRLSENPKHCPFLNNVRDSTCISIPTKIHLKHEKKPDHAVQVFSKLNKTDGQRSRPLETGEIQQNFKKPEDCKSFASRSLPMKLPENPRFEAHETGEFKQNLKKSGVCKSVLPTSTTLHMNKQPSLKVSETPKYCPALKKNSTEMLELFEIAKKSADVANAKGLLAAKEEASICVNTLSLLINFPISSTATETRRIMERLERLTKHKDRKICNSASALLHRWRQSIKGSTTLRCP